jgi:adenylate cyclase
LVDKLFDVYHAAIVGFDIAFPEKDQDPSSKLLSDLREGRFRHDWDYQSTIARLAPELDADKFLASKLRRRPVVLGYSFQYQDSTIPSPASGILPHPVFHGKVPAGLHVSSLQPTGYSGNLGMLQAAAVGAGFFNADYRSYDGVIRRLPMLINYRGDYYESLSLAVTRHLLGIDEVGIRYSAMDNSLNTGHGITRAIELANLQIPVDEQMLAWVPYRGVRGAFQYVSATDVLHERLAPGGLDSKIILIGGTGAGLFDRHSTPVGVLSGVEIHASMIAGILEQDIKRSPLHENGMEVLILLGLGVFVALLVARLSPLKATLFSGLMVVLVILSNWVFWQKADLVLPLASPVLLVTLLFAVNMSYGFFVQSQLKRRVEELFGQYVPQELVQEMSKHPEDFDMKGESREMTVLFADIRDFTGIAERIDPQQLSALLDAFFTPMTQVIHKYRGTVDKYIGDAVMAFWGAPLQDPDHARHAVLAALEMVEVLHNLDQQFQQRGWPALRMGVGINTGVMRVGNMGSHFRRAYTVIGDAVNLACRLEHVTKEYGVGIIVGEETRRCVPDVVFRELDRVRVQGRHVPAAIFEPIGMVGRVEGRVVEEAELLHQALKYCRMKCWDQAEQILLELRQRNPGNGLYDKYMERIAHFRAEPPDQNWDGVSECNAK